jgi:hypothetical protein
MSFSIFIIGALSINALSPAHPGRQTTDVHPCFFGHLFANGFGGWPCHDKFNCDPKREPLFSLWRSTLAAD